MLFEYAVEPKCFSNWQNFRYLIENFGVSQGRLLSQFPSTWPRQVYEVCTDFSFIQKQRVEVELKRLKSSGMIRSQRSYDGSVPWIENALSKIASDNPFHAIIVDSFPAAHSHVLVADELTHETPLWKVKRENRVPRTTTDFGRSAKALLQISDKILFVDKMFHPASERWRKMLSHFIDLAIEQRKVFPELEYHVKIRSEGYSQLKSVRSECFQDECAQFLSHLLPENVSLKIIRWDQRHQGDFFHERCILTEKGGIRFDWGLDVGKRGETTLVSLMEDDVWEQNWRNLKTETNTFEHIDTVTIVGTQRLGIL